MKSKIKYIILSIIQIIINIMSFINAKANVENEIAGVKKLITQFPKEIQESIKMVYQNKDQLINSAKIFSIIAIALVIIFLIIVLKDKIAEKKGLSIGLMIFLILFNSNLFGAIISIITIIFIANTKEKELTKEEKKEKETKKIKKLPILKPSKSEHIFGIILVLTYFSQIPLGNLNLSPTGGHILDIIFKLAILILIYLGFQNIYERDFKDFKEKKDSYVKYVFKWYLIMIAISFVTAVIRILLGGSIVTGNENALNELPKLYLIIMSIVFAPIVEEGIFRGFLRRYIKNDTLFIIISTVSFGLLHTLGTETGINILIQSIQYMGMGFVLSYTYTKTNNIFVNTSIHCLNNIIAMIVTICA